MEYRHLGRSGLLVSPVALGTMNFGPVTPEAEAHAIMGRALERGVTLFDTADVYGADANRTIADASSLKGRTEEIIGNWFAAPHGEGATAGLHTSSMDFTQGPPCVKSTVDV